MSSIVPLRTTGLEDGNASSASSTSNHVGDPTLTTLTRAHRDYFSCSECQQTLLLLHSTNDFDDTLIDVTLAHLAGHWITSKLEIGTNSHLHPVFQRALAPHRAI